MPSAGKSRAFQCLRVVAVAALVAGLLQSRVALAAQSVLQLAPGSFNFGSEVFGVSGAPSKPKKFTISNPKKKAAATVTISMPSIGGTNPGAFTVKDLNGCTGKALTPGAKCVLEVIFAPTGLGALTGTFAVTDSSGNSTKAASLRGSGVKGALQVKPGSLTFAKEQAGVASAPKTVTLSNKNPVALAISSITAGTGFNVSQNCAPQLAALSSCPVLVTFQPAEAKNPKVTTKVTGTLSISDDAARNPQKVSLSGEVFGTPGPTPTPLPVISGTAIQGGMNGATITAFAVNAVDGSNASVLGSTTAGSSGAFSVSLNSLPSGAVRITAGGGTFASEQDGSTIASPGSISVLLASVTASVSGVSINPLTDFINSLTVGDVGRGTALATSLTNATAAIEQNYGLASNPSGLLPDYTAGGVGTDAGKLGLILGAIINQDESLCPAAPGGLVTALSKDISDGVFDGLNSGAAIPFCGGNLASIGGTSQFQDALSGLQQLGLVTRAFSYGGSGNALTANGVGASQLSGELGQIEVALAGAAPASVDAFTPQTPPSMNAVHADATATLLPSGMVLIAGGLDSNGHPVASTDLYNPATNSFAPASGTGAPPSMNTARYFATATLVNGEVLIAGGYDGNGNPLASTELYNPTTNSFAPASGAGAPPGMNTARGQATATLLTSGPNSGMVLIAGGGSLGGSVSLASTELYNPTTNSFAPASGAPSMNTARQLATATLLTNGNILIAGGLDNSSSPLASTELYIAASNTFASGAGAPPNMNTGRYFAAATALAGGEVLIAGGVGPGAGFQLLASTELYNPTTNSFAPASGAGAPPNMNSAREAATATLLTSGPNAGMVLIAGGLNSSNNPLASTELYNATANSFAPASGTGAPPSMNAARGEATATQLAGGEVLIAGGFGPNPTSTELYNPVANSFAPASPPYLNTAREDATATLLPNGKVLIAGGFGPGSLLVSETALASTELYDPIANSFAPASGTGAPPSMNTAREDATATLLPNGNVLIAGGYDNSGNALASTELYDPATNSFAPASGAGAPPSMNTARALATATLLPNGTVLIAGGSGVLGETSSTELYNPVANSFAPTSGAGAPPSMNAARGEATATLLPNGLVLIAGGVNSSDNSLASTELYNPVANSFAPASGTGAPPNMNTARDHATATLLPNGLVLIAGGSGTSGQLASTELYNPVANSFAPASGAGAAPTMNAALDDATATLLPNGKVLIAGGIGADPKFPFLAGTQLYNPVANSFAPASGTGAAPTMNTARDVATATLLPNGKVLIAGGSGPNGILISTELYTP
jgi:hypothetical protein